MDRLTLPGGLLLGGAALLVDVVEDFLGHVGWDDGRNDSQFTATHGTQFDLNLENPLQSACPGKRSEGSVDFYYRFSTSF